MTCRKTTKRPAYLAIFLGIMAGCGPELPPETDDIVSGHYRALMIETDDSCGMGGVWSSDSSVAYSRDYFATLYANPVPIRSDGAVLEVPEPISGFENDALDQAWTMVPLMRTNATYEHAEAFSITFCDDYHYTWSAVALDEETLSVTREGTGCGEGDGQSRICDNTVSIEFALATPCPPPCELVLQTENGTVIDDAGEISEDVIDDGRCAC